MPKSEISLEGVLAQTKDRKSNKKCCDNSVQDCCMSDCNPDCCNAAFQRLDKLRMNWELQQQFGAGVSTAEIQTTVFNRQAQSVTLPVAGTTVVPALTGSTTTWGYLEARAAQFVQTVRYLNFEECGKPDQVIGWSVDLQTGNLYFYQSLPDLALVGAVNAGSNPGIGVGDSRNNLINTASTAWTPLIKQKLAAMEPFWKLSLKAIERVQENPKSEGNICEIKDKCGNRFLVAVNRVDVQANISAANYNARYSLVAVKL